MFDQLARERAAQHPASEEILTEANGWAGQNSTGYRNPEMDRLIDAIEIELDREKRRAMWHRLQESMPRTCRRTALLPGQSARLAALARGRDPTGHLNPSTLWVEHWRTVAS